MDAQWAGSIGEQRNDMMEQEELEALATTLPNDLATFVCDDNIAFQTEISRWDQEQLEKATKAANEATSSVMDNQQIVPVASQGESCNDVQVVEEKLTYVNNHAKLSLNLTHQVIKHVDGILKEKGPQTAVLTALEKLIGHYCEAHKKENAPLVITLDNGGVGSATSKYELLPKHDSRLESFVFYLLRNDETKNMPLVELAVLEQFSFPGLDMNTQTTSAFRNAADLVLQSRRTKHQDEANTLKQWHQAYHFFRRSVHCFVNGLECQRNAQFPEALDHYTEAYNYTVKANTVPVTASLLHFNFKVRFILFFIVILGRCKSFKRIAYSSIPLQSPS